MGQITPCLGSWTVGTGDLGRKDTNLALGFYLMVYHSFRESSAFYVFDEWMPGYPVGSG
jgi:hypothetical protein